MTTIDKVFTENNVRRGSRFGWLKRMRLPYELEEKRSYVAAGIGLAAAIIMLIVQAVSGTAPAGFFPVLGMLITWTAYIGIGAYVLVSIPVVIDIIRDYSVRAIILPALFIPAGLLVSWLAATNIGIPVFRWIVHDVMKEVTAREMAEQYNGLCLLASMTVGTLSVLYFIGRAGSIGKWPKALLITAAVSIPACMIPRIGTCIIFGISMSILLGFFCKSGGSEITDYSSFSSSCDCSSACSAEDDYHKHQDLVKHVYQAGGSKGLDIDEYMAYKEAVRDGEFSGKDMEYMARGMAENNSGRGYTRSDKQMLEDYDRLFD